MNLILLYLRKYRKLLTIALGLAVINQVFSLVSPQIMRIFMDQYATNLDAYTQETFIRWVIKRTLIAIGAAWISRIAKAFQDYYVSLMSQTIGSRLYAEWVSHSFSLPYRVFEDRQSGSLLDKLLKARTDIQNLLNSLISTVFITWVGILIVTVYAYRVHRRIGALFSLMVPLLAWTTMWISRRIRWSQKKIVKKSAELSGSTVENIKNVTLIKSLWLEKQEVDHLTSVNEELIGLEIDKLKIIKVLNFSQWTLINTLRNILQAVMLWMIFTWKISIGEFFSLLFYSFLLFNPLYRLPEVARYVQEARASSETLQQIFNLEKERHTEQGKHIEKISAIECKDITFSYDDVNAIKEISRKLEPGETIAFVGPSGSWKSTILKLLAGLYEPNTWEVLINHLKAKDVARSSVKQRLWVVSQDTQLFTGTVRQNLTFVAPHATDERCREVLANAKLFDFVKDHADWLDARIGEWWLKLSWWQKQRLAIARALLRDPDVLIFDEATSALDSLIEAEITETIKQIAEKNKSLMTILVAHRLSTIMHADTILVLEKGSIVERWKHDELVKKKGLYYAMWRQQSGSI